jgi:hypothetical protein
VFAVFWTGSTVFKLDSVSIKNLFSSISFGIQHVWIQLNSLGLPSIIAAVQNLNTTKPKYSTLQVLPALYSETCIKTANVLETFVNCIAESNSTNNLTNRFKKKVFFCVCDLQFYTHGFDQKYVVVVVVIMSSDTLAQSTQNKAWKEWLIETVPSDWPLAIGRVLLN